MLITSLVTAIMLSLPITAVAREASISSARVEEITDEKIMIELTSDDIAQNYEILEIYFKDQPTLYREIKKAFDKAIISDRDGSLKLDLEKYVNQLKPAFDRILPKMQLETSGFVPKSINNPTGEELCLPMTQQSLIKTPNTGLDPEMDAIARYKWNNQIRPILNSLTKTYWPVYREDTNAWDGDGPFLADEQSTEYDETPTNPSIKYGYQGLDDSTDWDFLGGLLYVMPVFAIGALICLMAFFLLFPLVTLVLIGIEITVFLQEAFDVKDLPYGSPSGPKDGK